MNECLINFKGAHCFPWKGGVQGRRAFLLWGADADLGQTMACGESWSSTNHLGVPQSLGQPQNMFHFTAKAVEKHGFSELKTQTWLFHFKISRQFLGPQDFFPGEPRTRRFRTLDLRLRTSSAKRRPKRGVYGIDHSRLDLNSESWMELSMLFLFFVEVFVFWG